MMDDVLIKDLAADLRELLIIAHRGPGDADRRRRPAQTRRHRRKMAPEIANRNKLTTFALWKLS
jgi:hypothetical protein